MPVEQLSISLPPKMARFIRAKVKSGRYATPGEAVVDAVRMMQDADVEKTPQFSRAELASIRQSVQQGVEELERGECEEFDSNGLRAFFEDVNTRGRKRFEVSRKRGK